MTKSQQQVVKRMRKLQDQGRADQEGSGTAALVGIVLMVGVVAWMYLVLVFSMTPVRAH